MNKRGVKAGDWVVVRSKEEILATLDERACLDELPFQPEMLAYCGRRMRVAKVAHKTCDNIRKSGGRRMRDAVHLEGARCDGAMHGGCQADCVFFWKLAWLRRDDEPPRTVAGTACTQANVIERASVAGSEDESGPVWVCQTTKLYDATGPLKWWDVRQYIRDVTTGNHTAWNITKLLVFAGYRRLVNIGIGYRFLVAIFDGFQKLHGGKPFPRGDGVIPDGQPTPSERLDLRPGEWVEVLPEAEIRKTLTKSGFNRGMRYDLGMSRYCGERYRVQMRVDRLINEITGRMMTMKSPCIQLENVYCRAECTTYRIGCPRASNTYWRENWLKRVEASGSPTSSSQS